MSTTFAILSQDRLTTSKSFFLERDKEQRHASTRDAKQVCGLPG